MEPFGIYIHWPYCRSKCPYCDFFSQVRKDIPQDKIIDGYLEDLDFYAAQTKDRTVSSIFFGGGTPSLISPKNLEKVLNHIGRRWHLDSQVEISLEANPNTDRPGLFSDLHRVGINRLSLGVQALNEADLKFLGRTHTLKQALESIDEVLHNFDNHSLDIIYARPQQTAADWKNELKKITTFGFKHLSLYQLTIEDGTVFARKGIQPLKEEAAIELYQLSCEFLDHNGYPQYEVSNFAKPAWHCHHNLLYWQGDDYLGIGPSAHGRLTIDKRYFALTHRCLNEELSNKERAEELLLMGLRLTNGINKTKFQNICGLAFDDFINQSSLTRLVADGLLDNTPQTLKATPRGFQVLNYLIYQLCP